ncbi:magnesium chelatase [Thermotoga maritima MSB8]|uniref:MoxR protein, putative n=1 Tax=Thermotoga maritima (strain ATCC 43589 / DSM 3109 / JCM 10099 / NBRC 100826 / MSB8) TaxID=243274 RepID=Q9X0L6_THEMA|nr:MoxR family ATPase [Thermotoga maritima]AAD36208.1 moxR protein, putative [Thermotoga maritima MSB8]AGL50062.1 MoxR-like ATPase [Thermotoga maritima MSB8]AHD18960.1 magnesium chelatase [Thermotoga maritima MSB8]AKE27042.1 magnesium chelatase [Thermotoga maritima]AKE28907.1 magnesium chelatase [Thermotoga maritima MSB8]
MIERVINNIEKVIKGKREAIEVVVAALLAKGHVLMEDVPGVGKTMLARALALSLGVDFRRVQFTPDLLPTDLTGLYIYDRKKEDFVFKKGPVFTDVLLADEINRATPRTQSALLEAMAEGQVTVDGVTHRLSERFFVIATQNPIEYEGTFPLPEAQLDRFMICVKMGYPDEEAEIQMLTSQEKEHPISQLEPVMNPDELSELQKKVRNVFVSDEVKKYIVDIASATRNHPSLLLGMSPRGSIALMHFSMALAFMDGRDFTLPDDVKRAAVYVIPHRVIQSAESKLKREKKEDIVREILDRVKVVK